MPLAASERQMARAVAAERRQLTVMFCDLVGSTALASAPGPRGPARGDRAYHRCVAETVGRFDGFVAKYMGDGVLVYFGYPQAHEDDAERAVRAGLGADRGGRADSQCAARRCGSASASAPGLVVVGDLIGIGEAQERGVVGETPNLAARLQALAEPDTVVIAPSTRRLVGDLFEYRDLGAVEVKGFAEPVQAWQVLRPSAVESRFEALHASGAHAARRARGGDRAAPPPLGAGQGRRGPGGAPLGRAGHRQVAHHRSPAGAARGEPHVRLRYFCSPHHKDSALYPIIEQFERAAGFEREDDAPRASSTSWRRCSLPTTPSRRTWRFRRVAFAADGRPLPAARTSARSARRRGRLRRLLRQLDGLARAAAGADGLRGRPLDRPDLARAARRDRRPSKRLPVLLIMTFRPGVPAALGRTGRM